jgi:hypothetical protein
VTLPFSARTRLLLVVLAVSTLVGAACAKLNTRGDLSVAAAATHVAIDDPDASIVDRRALAQDLATLQKRAELYAHLVVTPPVLDAIARRAGLPANQISGVARTTADVPIPLTEPGSEERASQIQDSRAPYRLELQSDPFEPILAIYAEAPSFDEAQRLANSAVLGLGDYLHDLAHQQGFDVRELPQLRQLGSARGGITNRKTPKVIAALTFLTAFALTFVGLIALLRRRLRRGDAERARRVPRRSRLTGPAAADWPRTTRVLPWSVAVLITMVWLTPFDRIQLSMSTPIDITLDRIVLPVVAVIWLIAFTAGPGAAPRLRLTKVHLALGAFLACAFLSVVLDARYLNQTGELMLAFKKLPLLFSYVALFVIVASAVRRSEVPAFMTYTLVLAVICGLGIIYEYRFHQNLFTSWSDKVFKGPFELVGDVSGGGVDSQGRRWVVGPAGFGVELVTMMTIAMPIAILGIIRSTARRQQALYGLAIVVLLAAMFATGRKSALLAPGAAVLTLAYFRRKELLSLAPLGLVIVVMVAAVSPDAVHGVISQFTRSNASHVATVSDRTADYDAIRPDLWTHLLFGRGHGTYTHTTYRILDSEILSRTVETGVLGLATFLMIAIALILVARKTVAQRHPRWAAPALCGVSAAVCFIVVATLYDVMAVPHGMDVFVYVAGLVVVVVGPGEEPGAASGAEREHAIRDHRTPGRRSAGAVGQPRIRAG